MVPFVKEILDCRHLTFLPYILIFGIFLPNPQILLHTSWKMSRYSFHPGFCKTYSTPLPPPHHIYYTFEGVYNWRSNTVVKGSISTSKPFDIFFSGSCCWSLGGLEDVEVVSPLEVAETLEEDSLPSFAIFDPCCGSLIFSCGESRSYNVCLVVLFSGSLRLVESLATAHRRLHLHRGNYCLPGKIREFLALRSLLRFGKRLLLFSRIASVPTACWF